MFNSMIYPAKSLAVRFWPKVMRRGANECWLWLGATFQGTYGAVWVNQQHRAVRAHRVAYLLTHGDIPKGRMILHRCGNKQCVNPLHLYAGGAQENAQDAIRLGHWPDNRGERHGAAKLTSAQVRFVRRTHTRGILAALSRKWGVSHSLLYMVRAGKRWTRV